MLGWSHAVPVSVGSAAAAAAAAAAADLLDEQQLEPQKPKKKTRLLQRVLSPLDVVVGALDVQSITRL